MEDEQLQFAEFRQFCELTLDEKARNGGRRNTEHGRTTDRSVPHPGPVPQHHPGLGSGRVRPFAMERSSKDS